MKPHSILSFFFCLAIGNTCFAQDLYHTELLALLERDYGLMAPSYVFFNTEKQNVEGMYIYGDASVQELPISDNTFSIQQNYSVHAAGNNAWDSGAGMRSKNAVAQGDVIVISFWARRASENSEVTFFAEDGSTFAKELDSKVSFTQDWVRYFAAFKAVKDYPVDGLVIGFHLATRMQAFELGGFTALNYGDVDVLKAPSSFSASNYGGFELDAAWRGEAAESIEMHRKKDLTIQVIDAGGNPVPNAQVSVRMQKHEFGFGSALVGCRFPGNRCSDSTYLKKIENLDDDGHGFNTAVLENALKWDGWEEEWIGTPEQTVSALNWLQDRDISVRGHTLVWPGWNHMPDDMQMNQNDLTYLRNRINGRLQEMLAHPSIGQLINEWDVLNEITQVRDLEQAFQQDVNLSSGREIYLEILEQARKLQPNLVAYVNDYVVLSGGGAGTSVVNRYKSYLDELVNGGAQFEGIGFQCHIGIQPTSILKIKEVLDEFSSTYGKRIKITEYDINPNVDEDTQAKYMSDFLTIVFSHPAVDAFLMWGFWDGNHWKGNAPIYNLDWSIKPSGQAFINKVFNDWWTNEVGTTDESGTYTLRPFKGEHSVKIEVNGLMEEMSVATADIDTLKVTINTTNFHEHPSGKRFQIYPNPASDHFTFQGTPVQTRVDLDIYDVHGKVNVSHKAIDTNQPIYFNLPAGLYFVGIRNKNVWQTEKLIVKPMD